MPHSGSNESVYGRVLRVSREPKVAPRGGYLFRGLEMADVDDNRRIFLIFPVFSGEDAYEFPLLCWEGALVAAYHIEVNNRLDDGTIIYHATPASELILEPYRPVSVTEAVDAADCVRSVDVRLRTGPGEPFWMAKGRLVHTLFEHLLLQGDDPPESTFAQAFAKALVALKEILPGSGFSVSEQELEKEARAHFENLVSWVEANANRFTSVDVEVDLISSRWGLKGRADAIFRGDQGSTVVELKSGRTEEEAHRLQLLAYALLMTSEEELTFPDGYLVYSANGTSRRLIETAKPISRDVLEGRNRVVALKYSYTLPQERSVYLNDQIPCLREGRCFSRRDCHRLFGDGTTRAPFLAGRWRSYYDEWHRLLSVDTWALEGDFARILDPRTLPERVEEGTTFSIPEIRVEQVTGSAMVVSSDEPAEPPPGTSPTSHGDLLGSVHNRGQHVLIKARFSPQHPTPDLAMGEEVILHRGDPCTPEAFRARVTALHDEGTTLRVKVPRLSRVGVDSAAIPQPFTSREGWFVDRIPFLRPREVSRQALFEFFKTADKAVIRAVVPSHADRESSEDDPSRAKHPRDPEADGLNEESPADLTITAEAKESSCTEEDLSDLCFSEGLSAELNEEQESAIRSALDCTTYHLIHGPPGTGKTRVLARLIRLCLDRGERVLVACPTNVALDGLLVAIMELGVKEFIRVGRYSQASRAFVEALEGLVAPPALLSDLCAADLDVRSFRQHVRRAKLVGATVYQCAAHPFFLRQRFDRVIVDEAGQLDEPSTLAALALAKTFVLGGDHLQLPPVVQTRSQGTGTSEAPALEQSLFERLFNSSSDDRISRLRMQYRMNQEVQDIPSRLFYDGSLFPSPEAGVRRLNMNAGVSKDPEINKIIDPDRPVVFVDVQGPLGGKGRPEEATVACRIVKSLLACGVPPHEVGIITPYRAQQALILKGLAGSGNGEPLFTVDTVDRFQGGEREVILLSLSRSDEVTSFLADRKRLNVSLSRARSKLILLGHAPILEGHPLFASVLEGLERITVQP